MTEADNMPNVVFQSRSSSTELARDSVRTFIARTIVMVLSVATGIVTAHWLGPTGKGLYSGTLLLISIVMIAPSGIGTAIIYELTKKGSKLSDLLPSLRMLLLWITGLLWIGAGTWGLLRGWNAILSIFVAAVPSAVVLAWQPGLYIALGRLRNYNVQSVILALATLASAIVIVSAMHGNAIAILAAWVACQYGNAIVVVWQAIRFGHGSAAAPLGATIRSLVRFGGLSSFNMLLGTINYRIDSIILVAIMGVASFGIYSIAVAFGELLFMLTRPITAAVTRDIGLRNSTDSADITARVIRTSTAIAALASVAALIVGPWAIDVVYGSRFHDAARPLYILLPGIVAFATAGTFAAFFIVQVGRPVIISLVNIAMILAQSGLCFALVPRLGMSGAALASTITYVVGAWMNTWWFCRITKLGFSDLWIVRRSDLAIIWTALRDITRTGARASRIAAAPSATHGSAQ